MNGGAGLVKICLKEVDIVLEFGHTLWSNNLSVCATNANPRNLLNSASKIRVSSYSGYSGDIMPDL
jgi:hypothetical protein